jgi:hypothetical protein
MPKALWRGMEIAMMTPPMLPESKPN